VPALIADLGYDASWRYVEFFTANIRNPHTRRAYGALLPMGRRRHGEDGPSRFIAKGSMPQLPLSTHCWGPPGWLTRVESKGFSDDPGAKLARAP
jgi:hypothetical protein